MELQAQSRLNKPLDDRPSINALVSQREFRQSLKRISEMSDEERNKYSSRFMKTYEDALGEIGFPKDSVGYKNFVLALATMNHSIFDRTY